MSAQQVEAGTLSRRSMLKESAALLVGGAAGGTVGAYAAAPAAAVAPASE